MNLNTHMTFIHWDDYVIINVINRAELAVWGLKWAVFMSALFMKVKVSRWLSSGFFLQFSPLHWIFAQMFSFNVFKMSARSLHERIVNKKPGVKVSVALNIMLHNTCFYNLRNCAISDSQRPRGATAALSCEPRAILLYAFMNHIIHATGVMFSLKENM